MSEYAVTTRSETYRGVLVELVTVHTERTEREYDPVTFEVTTETRVPYTYQAVRLDGRHVYRRPVGADDQVMTKLRKGIDVDIENAEMLPTLEWLTTHTPLSYDRPNQYTQVGDHHTVYAMGRERVGIVIKLTARKATIAFTTPSSGGRVYRKATDIERR